jgi:hypothetical protein
MMMITTTIARITGTPPLPGAVLTLVLLHLQLVLMPLRLVPKLALTLTLRLALRLALTLRLALRLVLLLRVAASRVILSNTIE